MNIMSLVRRADDSIDTVLEELQIDVADAIDESLAQEVNASEGDESTIDVPSPTKDEPLNGEHAAQAQSPADQTSDMPDGSHRFTPYAQSRLAALQSFSKIYDDVQAHLGEMDQRLSEVTASHQLTRKFFSVLDFDIRRASELELANAALILEQKKLLEQLKEGERARQDREAVIERLRQRESSLIQDGDALRAALATAKMELVEAANTIVRNETELGDLVKTLSARVVDAERRSRENEVLREKLINLSVDLDKAQKRETELRHKIEEMSAIHANETATNSELVEALGKNEREILRLQKALETAQVRNSELAEAARIAEGEKEAETARFHAEVSGLRSEIQILRSRLELAASDNSEASSEIARLKFQLSDATAERHVADEKLAALLKESESDKRNLSAANATISQLSLHQASEQIQLEMHKQQCEDLRAEIATLNARVKDLSAYERLYRIAKARQTKGAITNVEADDGSPEPSRATRGRSPRALRRRLASVGS